MTVLILFVIFTVMQAADAVTTAYVIDRKIGREVNPLMLLAIQKLGFTLGLFLPKVIVLTLIYLYAMNVYILAGLIALYSWVLLNNVLVIFRAK